MPPLFPHLKLSYFNTRNNKNATVTSTSQISTINDTAKAGKESAASQICDTCGCVHGFSLFAHEDKVECALNQIKKLESQRPRMKVYPPIEEVLPNFSLKTLIGFHKDDIDYWALALCWRYRARILMLHLEIAARIGDEDGIRRAKANFEDAGKVLEETIDEVFTLLEKNLERMCGDLKWKSPRPPTAVEENDSTRNDVVKESATTEEHAKVVSVTEDTVRRDSVMMDQSAKDTSLLGVSSGDMLPISEQLKLTT